MGSGTSPSSLSQSMSHTLLNFGNITAPRSKFLMKSPTSVSSPSTKSRSTQSPSKFHSSLRTQPSTSTSSRNTTPSQSPRPSSTHTPFFTTKTSELESMEEAMDATTERKMCYLVLGTPGPIGSLLSTERLSKFIKMRMKCVYFANHS